MKLDVRVDGAAVATLYREADRFALQYVPGTAPERFVSLTMPVRDLPWVWPRDLHPFFRQNLPEGYLLSLLREVFGPHLDGTDFSLLALVGAAGIGRVTVVPQGAAVAATPSPLDLAALLRTPTSPEAFAGLVRQHALGAVSGVVPKFLAGGVPQVETPPRATLRTARYLIKRASPQMPDMALNEYYTMQVLSRLNIVPVAKTQLSEDGQVLVVERFDVDETGRATHGLEDACSLLGLPPHEKYSPSMEQVLKATSIYLPDATRVQQLQQLGWQLITNMVVRNGDCHAKNLALTYTSLTDVVYAPACDLVTTQAYDGFRDAPPPVSPSADARAGSRARPSRSSSTRAWV